MRRRVAVCAFLSALALFTSALFGLFSFWSGSVEWLLVLWTLFLLPVAIRLLWRPMQAPVLGLMATIVAVVAMIVGIVVRFLVLAGWTQPGPVQGLEAWALFLIGAWLLLVSYWQLGAPGIPAWVQVTGMLAGLAIAATAAVVILGSATNLAVVAGVVGAVLFLAWAVGIGLGLWVEQPTMKWGRDPAKVPLGPVG